MREFFPHSFLHLLYENGVSKASLVLWWNWTSWHISSCPAVFYLLTKTARTVSGKQRSHCFLSSHRYGYYSIIHSNPQYRYINIFLDFEITLSQNHKKSFFAYLTLGEIFVYAKTPQSWRWTDLAKLRRLCFWGLKPHFWFFTHWLYPHSIRFHFQNWR